MGKQKILPQGGVTPTPYEFTYSPYYPPFFWIQHLDIQERSIRWEKLVQEQRKLKDPNALRVLELLNMA